MEVRDEEPADSCWGSGFSRVQAWAWVGMPRASKLYF